MIVKIVKALPMVARDYTDRQGQNQVFKSKGFVLHDGESSFYAEALQENAESLEALNPQEGKTASVHMHCVARDYKTQAGEQRYSNEFIIRRMMVL